MHKYKLNFKMADGSMISGDSTSNLNLESYAESMAKAERHVFHNSNGVQSTVVNMRHVAALEVREVWR